MFRNALLVLGTTVGLLGVSDTMTSSARADISISIGRPAYYPQVAYPVRGVSVGYYGAPVGNHHHHHYHVYYRTCNHEPWRLYGTYGSHAYAHSVVERLHYSGYLARVAHH